MRALAGFWKIVARGVGRFGAWKVRTWHSPGGQRVLVVATHPDDEIACAGTLILHLRAGDTVDVAYVTDGRASRAFGLDPEEMARRRREESRAAGRCLELTSSEWLALPEGAWDDRVLVEKLRDVLQRGAPHVVYAPSRVDFHPEHIRVAGVLARALSPNPAVPSGVTIRVYEMHVPLTPVLVNLVTPVGAALALTRAAMGCYVTQIGSIERTFRMRHYGASLFRRQEPVESFWEMDADTYRAVHGQLAPSADTAFRGLRARPFVDPLAYLRGLRARRDLRKLVT